MKIYGGAEVRRRIIELSEVTQGFLKNINLDRVLNYE